MSVLPRIANNVDALHTQLADLAGLTLCWLHFKKPDQHTRVTARWNDIICQAETVLQAPLSSPRPLGHRESLQTTQSRQRRQTEQASQPSEPNHETVASALDPCTICLDDVGANGGLKTLSCRHTYCKGCIDRWWNESHNCPLCRNTGADPAVDQVRPLSQTSQLREGASHSAEDQQLDMLSRISELVATMTEQFEEATRRPTVVQSAAAGDQQAGYQMSSISPVPSRPVSFSSAGESSPAYGSPVECGICLEGVGHNGGAETLQCSHTFCSDCISQWLRRSPRCPYRCERGRTTGLGDARRE
jgi:hypothetical protein